MKNKDLVSYEDVLTIINDLVKINNGNQSEAAKIIGVSQSYLCSVIHRRVRPGPKILEGLKLHKVIMYGV